MRALAAAALGVLLASCQVTIGAPGRVPAEPRPPHSIAVASFDFSESVILAELYSAVLEQRGHRVIRMTNLGSREIVQPALLQDVVDIVPEYVGTALSFATLGHARVTSNAAAMHRRLQRVLEASGVSVLDMARAENENGIVVAADTAARYDLEDISDLREHAAEMSFGGPPECTERPLCLPGLEQTYGLRFERFVPLDPGGPTTVAALTEGDIDVALLFTTDPHLTSRDLVLLRDDRRLQPAENIVPIVRSSVLERFGNGLRNSLRAVSNRLTTPVLRRLNFLVDVRERDPGEVARRWLIRQGLVS